MILTGSIVLLKKWKTMSIWWRTSGFSCKIWSRIVLGMVRTIFLKESFLSHYKMNYSKTTLKSSLKSTPRRDPQKWTSITFQTGISKLISSHISARKPILNVSNLNSCPLRTSMRALSWTSIPSIKMPKTWYFLSKTRLTKLQEVKS